MITMVDSTQNSKTSLLRDILAGYYCVFKWIYLIGLPLVYIFHKESLLAREYLHFYVGAYIVLSVLFILDLIYMFRVYFAIKHDKVAMDVLFPKGIFRPSLYSSDWFLDWDYYKKIVDAVGENKNIGDEIRKYANEQPSVASLELEELLRKLKFRTALKFIKTAKARAIIEQKKQSQAMRRQSHKQQLQEELRERSEQLGVSQDDFDIELARQGVGGMSVWLDELVIQRRLEQRKAEEAVEQQRRMEQQHRKYLDELQAKAEGISNNPNIRDQCLQLVRQLRGLERGSRPYRMIHHAFDTKLGQLKT